MDFDQAIAAHSKWKGKLRTYIASPDGSLSAPEIALDNKCELGKWISGEGAKYSNLPEFKSLRSQHAHFHKAAAEIVRKVDAGHNVTEEVALGAKSEFSSASADVVSAIMALKAEVAKHVLVSK
jgi:Chemoreceptor zinc-binding domain